MLLGLGLTIKPSIKHKIHAYINVCPTFYHAQVSNKQHACIINKAVFDKGVCLIV